eukprot:SAG31_NODE_12192_length_960_cov_1.056911_1_plen_22_part_10
MFLNVNVYGAARMHININMARA